MAVAEVIPEADGLLGAGFHEPEEGVAGIAAGAGAGAGGDFAARDLAADIVFRAVGMQREQALKRNEFGPRSFLSLLRVKGGIIWDLSEMTALGSKSRLRSHGFARKPLGQLS